MCEDKQFYLDETGLNFSMFPSKTLAAKREAKTPVRKKSKERITVLSCNASSTLKLKSMFIGMSKKLKHSKRQHIESSFILEKPEKFVNECSNF